MAESATPTPVLSSSTDNMTSLARALSHSKLSQIDQSEVFQSQTSLSRMGQVRRRAISSSQSLDSLEVSPSSEARVLVINTGGTIGMMYHNNGKNLTWLIKPVRDSYPPETILQCRIQLAESYVALASWMNMWHWWGHNHQQFPSHFHSEKSTYLLHRFL